ncbi:hypothetical protein ACSBR1_035203 [Camellia fascicularis]
MNHYRNKNTIVRISSMKSDVFNRLKMRKILGTPDFGPHPVLPNSVVMKLLIWNYRGADNKAFKRTIEELEKTHRPSIVGLMETKFFNKLGFTASSHVDLVGRSGRIWALWDPFRMTVETLEVNALFIHVKIKRDNFEDWILSAIYASPNPRNRDLFWENLKATVDNMNFHWLVTGDFNEIASQSEKRSFSTNASQRYSLEAEMWGSYHGLTIVLGKGLREVIIETDSTMAEELLTKGLPPNCPYQSIVEDSRHLIQ